MYSYDARERVLTITFHGIIGRVLISVLLLALATPAIIRSYRTAMSEYLVHTEEAVWAYDRAIRYDPSNGEYWWMSGRFHHHNLELVDMPRAIKDYERALSLNPRLGKAWLDLADAYEQIGASDKAEISLQNALRVRTHSPSAYWHAGNFYLLRGDLQKMYPFLKTAAENDPEILIAALQLVWKVDPNHEGIEKKLIPSKLPAYFLYLNFLVKNDELDLAAGIWDKCLKLSMPDQFQYKVSLAFPYIDHLLLMNRAEEAFIVWNQALAKAGFSSADHPPGSGTMPVEPGKNLVWNGSFEDEVLNGGWDWRYSNLPDVEIQTETTERIEGLRSMRFKFGGANKHYILLRQIVPTFIPGTYHLDYYAKTDDLTSDQRTYFLVQSLPERRETSFRTEMLPASSGWQKHSLSFQIEPGTKVIELVLARDSSQKLANQLQGTLWLDQISVHFLSPATVHRTRP